VICRSAPSPPLARAWPPDGFREASLARIEHYNAATKAFITVDAEGARAAARRAVEAVDGGLLNGIPYTCKDLFQTKGLRTTGGSRVLADWLPDSDAAVIERLADAGAVLLGKANLHEFAYGATGENAIFGTPPNPWDPSRLAGGSSSGSAVAVAGGMAAFALGTDTGGSVRVPAALCGLVGFKPSYGRVSCHGVIPFSWSLDHVGILTRTVADCASVFDAVAGFDPRDAASADVAVTPATPGLDGGAGGLRMGIPRSFYFDHVGAEIAAATEAGINLLAGLGAGRADVDLPDMTGVRTVSLLVQMPEALSYHSRYLRDRADLYGDDLRAGLALGQFILAEHHVRARRMIEVYRRHMEDVFRQVDVIITPATPLAAPEIGATTVDCGAGPEAAGNALTRLTTFFNMSGNPALVLPTGLNSAGLPMALQIIGRPFEEATVLRVARALEAALALDLGTPPMFV
jgi:aspartyl-tRNA(Asn)/glutamyl-tRNA(Gln) amidotransferase subunit A